MILVWGSEATPMSRSKKKSPVLAMTCAESEKDWKKENHRRFRRKTKTALQTGEEPPEIKEVTEIWDSPKDGKRWWGNSKPLTDWNGNPIEPHEWFGK